MMSVILKRFSSTASRRTLSALASVDSVLHNLPLHFNPATSVLPRNTELLGEIRCFSSLLGMAKGGSDVRARSFHAVSRPLNFRSSLISQADFATAREYSFDEEKGLKGDSDEGLDIAKLGISQQIVSALSKKNITKLFPIQRAVLEPAMQGRDMIGRARTGTGKTLAFGIPILDKIIRHNATNGEGKYPLALVMAPTRELANQVKKEFSESAPELLTLCIYGGVPIGNQMRQLDRGADVVVGTPGRLIDLMNRGALVLSDVQFLVLDEADQMLQVGFQEDVERIMDRLPRQRQSLMFSATMPSWIKDLSRKYLRDPLIIDLVGDSDQKLADGISLYSIMSDTYRKASIIEPLVTEHAKGGKCIVFTQTKRDADRLSHALEGKLKCQALHGDISQNQRERTLSGFREGYFNVLVATDVAARGLDVPNVDLVIHYDLPNSSEIFIHRSGRTGRAGKSGTAILIHSQDQTKTARLIERDVGRRFNELPKISVEGGALDMFSDMGGGGRFGSGGMRERGSGRYGGQREQGFGRSGGYGNSGFGRSGGYGDSGFGRSGGYGDSGFGRSGGYGDSGFGRSGSYGDSGSGRSGSYGSSGSGRSGSYGSSGFGNSSSSGRFSSFSGTSSSPSGSSFGANHLGQSSRFGQQGGSWEPKGAERSGGFDSFGSGRRAGFGDLGTSQGSSFGKRFGDGRTDGQDDESF